MNKSFYNRLLDHIIVPLGDLTLGSSLKKDMRRIESEMQGSEEEIKQLQKNKLNKLLIHAINNSTYYARLVEKLKSEDPYLSIHQFPVLEKKLIRNNYKGIVTKNIEKLYPQKSSGSSGYQTTVYWSKDEFSPYRAINLVWWKWAGYNLGDHLLQTGINTNRKLLKSAKDILFRTYYLNAFSHDISDTEKALKWLQSKPERILGGYASSLYTIACYAEKLGIEIKLKSCISWGDKLFDHYRTKIESVFQTKVYQNYGSSEGFLIAAQKDLEYMYINDTNFFLEIVDDEGNEVKDGELGHVLVTNLNNYTMPLIRYRIGDLAIKLPKNEYPSNRELKLSLLKRIVGRDTDLVRTNGGKVMVVHSFTGVFEHFQGIKQYQVIQNDLFGITIHYIKEDQNMGDDIVDQIRNKFNELINEADFKVNMKEVEAIKASPSGKPQIIVSTIPQKFSL